MPRKYICCRCGEMKQEDHIKEWGEDSELDYYLICTECNDELIGLEAQIRKKHDSALHEELKIFKAKQEAGFKFRVKK